MRTRLLEEMKEIEKDSALGVSCGQDDKDPLRLNAVIFADFGPNYENGMFTLKLHFSEDYPFTPPVVKFD